MSGLRDLKTRVNYRGGARQQDRMIADKLASLQKALIYSYQGATAKFGDKTCRCLINPSKVNLDEDVKVISVPFDAAAAPGQVFEWEETRTHWLIYDQHLEEYAYFRGEIRRCDYEVEVNGNRYWVYFKGPRERTIDWRQSNGIYFNEMNYTGLMYITNNEETSQFFKRFAVIKINGEPWEVQSVDRLTNKGILVITLKEWYKNTIAEENAAAAQVEQPSPVAAEGPRISGSTTVYPYSQYTYTIEGYEEGVWSVSDSKKLAILSQTPTEVEIGIVTGRSGSANVIYTSGNEVVTLPLTIASL